MTLSGTAVIPGLNANLFSVAQSLQKGSWVTSERESLIIKKDYTKIHFEKEMVNHSGEGFLLTTKFYKGENDATLLEPNNQNREGKVSVQPEGTVAKNQ